MILKNTIAKTDEKTGKQYLDFKYTEKLPSERNTQMTLDDDNGSNQIIFEFGKLNDNTYNMRVNHPFNIL